jgi:hypothetical protein
MGRDSWNPSREDSVGWQGNGVDIRVTSAVSEPSKISQPLVTVCPASIPERHVFHESSGGKIKWMKNRTPNSQDLEAVVLQRLLREANGTPALLERNVELSSLCARVEDEAFGLQLAELCGDLEGKEQQQQQQQQPRVVEDKDAPLNLPGSCEQGGEDKKISSIWDVQKSLKETS